MTDPGELRVCEIKFDLIVTIVNKGHSHVVVDASKKIGAEGGTILGGRGTGVHERAKLFGIAIEPEKEIILTLVPHEAVEKVLGAIVDEAELNKPGKGITFVLDVSRVAGIKHLLEEDLSGEMDTGSR